MFIGALLGGMLSALIVIYLNRKTTIDDQFDDHIQSSNIKYSEPLATKSFPEYDRIIEELFTNQTRITVELFNKTLKESTDPWYSRGASILVQIINGNIYVGREYFTTYLPWDKLRYHHILSRLQKIIRAGGLDDLEFILNTHDCPVRQLTGGPIFSITRCAGMNVIPVPQWFAWRDGSFENWDNKMLHYQESSQATPWGEKLPLAIFRGNVRPSVLQLNQTTNRLQFVNITEETYTKLGRTKLYALGQDRPDLLDVGIYGKGLESAKHIIELFNYVFKPPLSMVNQASQYRYVLYAEGACGWADRLKVLLVSGMLIFLQETPCVEFFQMALHPWIHYVPIRNDFSDLIKQIQWANEHEDSVREIIQNATEFGLLYDSQAGWDYYLRKVMKSYADLLDYVPNRRNGTRRYLNQCSCPNRRDLKCDDSASFQIC